MKRSEDNKALRELEAMCEQYHCYLPPFCHFTPEELETKGHEYDEVRDCCLGWDITDYGMGDFDKFGFSLITIRNGDEKIVTGMQKIGALVGDFVEVGCNSVLNPGTVVGRNTTIYPTSCVRGVVPANRILKTGGLLVDKEER